MKRLDAIVKAIYNTASIHISERGGGYPGFILWIRPSREFTCMSKISITCKNKPQKKTIEKLVKAEIKVRLLDSGWYRSELKRLIKSVHFDTIQIKDEFNGQIVELTGYRFRGEPGLYSDWTGALIGYLDKHSPGLWEEYCGYDIKKEEI